jgi:hypothetical protein
LCCVSGAKCDWRGLQESGKENLFIFGVDANDITRLRAERKDFKDYDPRFLTAIKMIQDGVFGDVKYFEVCTVNTVVVCV